MVQEPDTLSQASSNEPLDADGLPPVEIEDTTDPGVIRQEETFFDSGDATAQDVEPTPGVPAEEPGTDETPAPTAEQGTQTEPPPAPPVEQETPQSEPVPETRTYSQDEVAKIQSAYDRQVAEQNKRLQELERNYQRQQVDNQVEAELQRQEQQLTQQVGAEEARRIVRDSSNQEAVREALQARAELETVRQERNQFEQQSRMAVMNNWIANLQSQHNLSADDVGTLQSLAANPAILSDDNAFVQTGEAMAGLAARLGATAEQRAVASSERKNLVPRETPETALESGQSIAQAPPNDDAQMAAIMDKPSWEWTDAEADLVNRRSR